MALFDALKKALGLNATEKQRSENSVTGTRSQAEPEEDPRVPEVTAQELMAEMREEHGLGRQLLDCREHYERAQSYIPDSLHIPMNSIPQRLAELDRGQEIVVYCAHGNRSYGVAGWLNQQGYTARSLKGGIVDWQRRGGPVESAYRKGA